MSESQTLKAGASVARFSASGAECRAWRVGDRAILWPGDPDVWPGVAPVLFPVCGWSAGGAVRVDGVVRPMPVHGFAATRTFQVQPLGPDAIRFTLCDDDETRRMYPFAFELAFEYRLFENTLETRLRVRNRGSDAMPYACGLHPGFVWSAGAHRLRFEAAERPEVPVIAPGGLFSSRKRPIPLSGRDLDLTPDLFAAEAMCFLETRSRSVELQGPDGVLGVEAPDFPHLVLWSRPPAPFLCIESWTGQGDPEGFLGELRDRPFMTLLPAGAERSHVLRWTWRPHPLGKGGATS